jgi:hypothetical protein
MPVFVFYELVNWISSIYNKMGEALQLKGILKELKVEWL